MSDSPACRRLAHRTGVWWCQTRVMGATTVIALLRGINVGGHNKLPMAQLREIAASIGLADVQTYIQSGNLVASTDGDPVAVGPALAEAITSATGLTVPVIVRTGGEWAEVVAANPFPDAVEPGKLVHVICLPTRASESLRAFDACGFAREEFAVVGSEIYLHLPEGLGRSKLVMAVNRLPEAAAGTARNGRPSRSSPALAHLGPVSPRPERCVRISVTRPSGISTQTGWWEAGQTVTGSMASARRSSERRRWSIVGDEWAVISSSTPARSANSSR